MSYGVYYQPPDSGTAAADIPESVTVPLDDAFLELLAGLRQAAILLFLRQRQLPGTWALSADGRELIRKS